METQVTSSRSLVSQDTQEVSMDKLNSYLLHGNKAEGLKYAMRVGLWGPLPGLQDGPENLRGGHDEVC